jgi:hypothetical protein
MKYLAPLLLIFSLGLVSAVHSGVHPGRADIERSKFYAAMENGKIAEVDALLTELETGSLREKNAYAGALMIRKAGLTGKLKEKLSLFKSGRNKLEEAISNDEGNVEYHFIRLIVQENAPKILGYRDDLKSDAQLVKNSFKMQSPELQQIIRDYSETSKVLKGAVL